MTQKELLKEVEETYKKGLSIIKIKNSDYAGGNDAFRNFRSASVAGISPERAIVVRILDKLSRISNLLDKEASVKDESIEDTLIDLCNYTAILKAFLKDKNKTRKKQSEFREFIEFEGQR